MITRLHLQVYTVPNNYNNGTEHIQIYTIIYYLALLTLLRNNNHKISNSRNARFFLGVTGKIIRNTQHYLHAFSRSVAIVCSKLRIEDVLCGKGHLH